ncbi:MAG TPA: hypothetical protein VFO60_08055 [Candidatus Dormibacteraeota bacterium]|nr:hypothetical protein [Candidatus Dormibacteraeota bacterium]
MAAAEAPRPPADAAAAPGGLPHSVDLGDGTVSVRGRRGEVRLSRDRSRWWNGRMWLRVGESTPWNAHMDGDGRRWWDGVEWRARAATEPAWTRRPVLAVLGGAWLVIVVLLVAGALPGLVGAVLLVVVGLPGAVLTLTSKVLRGGEKALFLLSVVGLLIMWVRGLRARRSGGAGDGSAHLVM